MSEMIPGAQAGARVMPHNLNAEKSVLGAMMASRRALAAAIERLSDEDFYYLANRRMFSAMVNLFSSGQPVDFVTLTNMLEKTGALEDVGGYDYVLEVNTFVPTSANIAEYITIVEENSLLRRLIEAAAGILDDCYGRQGDVDEILASAEKAIFNISQKKHRKGFVSIDEALTQVVTQIYKVAHEGAGMLGLKTGYPSLDRLLSGLHPSDLILLASRPGMGKTSFALNILQYVARFNENAVAAIFELEMPYEQLVSRLLSSASNVPLQDLRSGRLDGMWKQITMASGTLGACKIFIDDTPGVNVMEMRSKCRRLKMEQGLSLVVIDYLQLISGAGGGGRRGSESRQQEISDITRALKIMARELDVPVVLLSQLNRAVENRPDKRPRLSDLRESGAIEQDADIVMFLYRPDYYQTSDEEASAGDAQMAPDEAQLIIAKHRNGPTDTIRLKWDAATTSYRDALG